MAVTVPPGHGPGMLLNVHLPDGQVMSVVVPQGVAAGGQFVALLPAAAAQPQMAQAAVVGVAQAVATSSMGPMAMQVGQAFPCEKANHGDSTGTVPYPWSTSTP